MELMKFSKLSLLSNKERRGLQIDFSSPATVLVAGNGFGKSAILKSLYEALGCKPHKVDQSWRDAKVTTLLEFSVAGKPYSMLKVGDLYTIQDADKRVLLSTNRIVSELGPFLANLLSFKLVLANTKDERKVPPPSYIFAPYYVDQDRSWNKPWDAFSDLKMFPNSAKPLSEYHSGLRPNAYYEAKAERDLLKAELAKTDAERQAIDQAARKINTTMPNAPIVADLNAFKEETEQLVHEGQKLHDEQAKYRKDLSVINEELNLWTEHVGVVEAALSELDASFNDALQEGKDVECPMCGQHYHNHIADQFELVADKDELMHALLIGRQKVKEHTNTLRDQRLKLDGVEAAIERVNQVLAVHRHDISLQDVVVAQGRTEAQRVLNERLKELDAEAGDTQRKIADAELRMQEADSKQRQQTIKLFFSSKLRAFAQELDVPLPDRTKDPIQGLQIGRGSVGPRALAAYYYAFLHTVRDHGSAVFCPIVIDAPNQQGQDKGHLDQIMRFLLKQAPTGAQIIIGTEAISNPLGAKLINVANKKDHVLKEEAFESTLEYVRPFLSQSIM